MLGLETGYSNEAFTKKALVTGISVMFFMTLFFSIFFTSTDSEGEAPEAMDDLLANYYSMTGTQATSEEVWALSGIYTPYGTDRYGDPSAAYGVTDDGWVYGDRVTTYYPAQYGNGTNSDVGIIDDGKLGYTVVRDSETGLYYYTIVGADYTQNVNGTSGMSGIAGTITGTRALGAGAEAAHLYGTVTYSNITISLDIGFTLNSSGQPHMAGDIRLLGYNSGTQISLATHSVNADGTSVTWAYYDDGYLYINENNIVPTPADYYVRVAYTSYDLVTSNRTIAAVAQYTMVGTGTVTGTIYSLGDGASDSVTESIVPYEGGDHPYSTVGKQFSQTQNIEWTDNVGTSGSVYTRVNMDRAHQSTKFFSTGSMTERADGTFYYEYSGYRYAFSPIEDYQYNQTLKVHKLTSSCSLVWYKYVTDSGIAGQLIIDKGNEGVSYITSTEIIAAYNSATMTARFTMSFANIDVYVYIMIDPYAYETLGYSIADCYNYGYWSVMLTTPKYADTASASTDLTFDASKLWDTTVSLLTFNGESFGLSSTAATLSSFVFSVSLYTSLIAIGLSCWPILLFTVLLAVFQAAATFLGGFNFSLW